jgi:hypothetical protein
MLESIAVNRMDWIDKSKVSRERQSEMATPKHQFVVDDDGKKKAVILDIAEYRRLLEEAEELEAIRAYDAAHAAGGLAE